MNKRIIVLAAFFGTLAVILGAFGAHTIKNIINVKQLDIWQTAVQYHFYHTFALLFLATFGRFRNRIINFSSWCFVIGIVFFSGSLYVLALQDILKINAKIIGPITPLGGFFFILGWLSLLIAALRNK